MRSEEIDFFNTSALAHTHTRGPSAHTHSLLLLHTHTNALEISQKIYAKFSGALHSAFTAAIALRFSATYAVYSR